MSTDQSHAQFHRTLHLSRGRLETLLNLLSKGSSIFTSRKTPSPERLRRCGVVTDSSAFLLGVCAHASV